MNDDKLVCVYCDVMQQVLVLTQSMLEHATQDEWDKVALLEIERVTLLQNHGDLPSEPETISHAADLVSQIQATNLLIVDLGNKQIKSLSAQSQDIGRGRQAVAAYGR
ncbi:MAG: flagellar protein FliT [Gammaproteobacteria bacterium]|nr:flagellar protein FliT [Gammaproteobacteria bacterium]